MKYRVKWIGPGDVPNHGPSFDTIEAAQDDMRDVSGYEGITAVAIEVLIDDGEIPAEYRALSKLEANAFAASQWWTKHDNATVALAQARQPTLCMPFGLFKETCEAVLGEILTDSAFVFETLAPMLERKLGITRS